MLRMAVPWHRTARASKRNPRRDLQNLTLGTAR